MKLHTTYRSINYRQIIAGQLQELELNSHLKEKRDKQVDTPFALSLIVCRSAWFSTSSKTQNRHESEAYLLGYEQQIDNLH